MECIYDEYITPIELQKMKQKVACGNKNERMLFYKKEMKFVETNCGN